MNGELNPKKIETLKSRFRAFGCGVKDIKGATFEVVLDDLPVRTHVYANPYYLQFATQILAKPRTKASVEDVFKFLCNANLEASFVKFTIETKAFDRQTGAWPVLASVKLVTGVADGNYDASALKNLMMLWLQDIADIITTSRDFEIHPMLDEERLRDD